MVQFIIVITYEVYKGDEGAEFNIVLKHAVGENGLQLQEVLSCRSCLSNFYCVVDYRVLLLNLPNILGESGWIHHSSRVVIVTFEYNLKEINLLQCVIADSTAADIRRGAFDFDFPFECPDEILVDDIFSCNVKISGANRVRTTIQWEAHPPINHEFRG